MLAGLAALVRPVLLIPVLLTPASVAPQELVLLEQGSPMRYLAPAADPGFGADWVDPDFDDGSWAAGTYGVGYNAGGMISTTVPDTTHTVYTRARFRLEDLAAVESVHFGADYDDGYVAWINGQEVARAAMPAGPPGFATNAANHESSNGAVADYSPVRDVSAAALPALLEGENVLAVGVWNTSGSSSDLALVPFLSINRPGNPLGTEVCGTLGGDVTLSLDRSPYAVTCDVVVPADAVLRIEPGVEILVEGGVAIDVAGRLVVAGTEAEPIRITAAGGRFELSDPVYLLSHLFRRGPAPPRPYPSRGLDPTAQDALGCERGL